MKKLVSFIIPHKGRELFLQKTIASIIDQDFDLSLIEIIVVTQNDKLSNAILLLKEKINLTIVSKPVTKTISYLRNFGVQQSHGGYLAFLDADISLSKNWTKCMLFTLNEDKLRVIVSGSQINSKNPTALEQIRTALSASKTDTKVDFLPGCNLFLSKETFLAVGGFPENLISCEDYYFSDQANKFGILFRTSKATYIHLGEDKVYKDMYRKEIWRGQSNLQSIKGRRIKITELPSLLIPIWVMLFLLVGVLSLMTGFTTTAIISLIAFFSPITIYTFRLYRITKSEISLKEILKFYTYYFPARAVGTIGGAFKTFSTKSHS